MEDVVARKGGYDLGQQRIAARQGAGFGIVVDDTAEIVRHQDPLVFPQIQHLHGDIDVFLVQGGEPFQLCGQGPGPLQKVGLFGIDDQAAHCLGRVKIEHPQQGRQHHGHHQGDAEPQPFSQPGCWHLV